MSRSSLLQVCYAKELKEGFVEYTEQVVKLMVPLLKFYFHDDILLVIIGLIICHLMGDLKKKKAKVCGFS